MLLDHFADRLLGIMVFGSIARGDWKKDSDIDLLVVVDGWDSPAWSRTRELILLINKLRQTPEYRSSVEHGFIPIIQHYPLNRREAETSQRIYIDACVDGIILYEKDGFLSRVMEGFRRKMRDAGAKRVYLRNRYYWVLWEGKAGEVFEL